MLSQIAEVNCCPWSEVKSRGMPYRTTHPSVKVWAHSSAGMSVMGKASGHLEVQSVTVKRYEKPQEGGQGVIASAPCMKQGFLLISQEHTMAAFKKCLEFLGDQRFVSDENWSRMFVNGFSPEVMGCSLEEIDGVA